MLQRFAFTFRTLPTHSKNIFEYDQIKLMIFRFKRRGYKSLWKEKRQKTNHKLPSFRCSLKSKDTFSCEILTQKISPSFQPIFKLSTKNVNLSKQTRKQRKSLLLVFPSLNTSNFTTYLKIASTLTPFWGARLKSHPSKLRSLPFWCKRKLTPKMEKFPNFFP